MIMGYRLRVSWVKWTDGAHTEADSKRKVDLPSLIRSVAPSAFTDTYGGDPLLRAIAENAPCPLRSKKLPGRPRRDGLPSGSPEARYADGKLAAPPQSSSAQWLDRFWKLAR